MAESKRTGTKGSMNKDLDDRLLPEGFFRDALNVSVGHSEGSDVGAIENLRGNTKVAGTAQDNITGAIIGSVVDPDKGYIYYFVSETDHDVIYEYNPIDDTISTVIRDERAPGYTPPEDEEVGGGGGDSGGGGGGGGTTYTASVDAFTITSVITSETAGAQQYKLVLSCTATSTEDGDGNATETISTYNFEEYTDNTYATAKTTQPGTNFGSTNYSAATIETTPVSKVAATRYFKVTVTSASGSTASSTEEITITDGVQGLNGYARKVGGGTAVTQGTSFAIEAYSVSGGVSPYSYSWSGPNSFSSSSRNPTVTSSASSSHVGTYNVTISDSASPANTITRGVTISVTTFGTPDVDTVSVTAATATSLQFNGYVNNGGNPGSVSSRGFYYYKNTSGTQSSASTVISNGTKITEGGGGDGAFSVVQSSLDSSSTYDIVAWAHNGSNEGRGDVQSGTTASAGVQSIEFSPTSLTDKPAATQSYQVDLTLTNLPDSLINTSITYATGGTGWISSVTRRSGTNTYDITFAVMTAQTSTSPTNRVASIQFTNPTSGTSATLSCHQTLGASIDISSNTGVTTINKLGGSLGVDSTVSFDPSNSVQGKWNFFDTLPSWITGTQGDYYGNTTVTFTLSNNTSGSDRSHTFDARIVDGFENDSTYQVRDTLVINQNQTVPVGLYEYQDLTTSQKTGLIFYRNNGSFQQANFKLSVQGNNTDDNVLRMTATPTGANASEVTSVQYRITPNTGDYANSHFLINGSSPTQNNWVTVQNTGGSFNLTVTAPTTWDGGTQQVLKNLQIRATAGTSTTTYSVSLNRTA